MTSLHTLPVAATALPPGRHLLILLLLASATQLGRLAARLAHARAPAMTDDREAAALTLADGRRVLAVYEGGRLVAVLQDLDRL